MIDYRRVQEHARLLRRLWKYEAGPKAVREWLTQAVRTSEKALTTAERDAYLKGEYEPT